MSLKKLSQFENFDIEGFLENISLGTVGKKDWTDYETGTHRGTKLEVVILSDKNNYKTDNGKDVISNEYEKFTVKIARDIDVPMKVRIRLINPTARIYGQFRNQLSVTAEDIEVISK